MYKKIDKNQWIREARLTLGMTQTELAIASGISLPSIQNIEAGKANPSLQTLESLLTPLNLQIEITTKPADWDLLAVCGAPLLSMKRPRVHPSSSLLLKGLRAACLELQGGVKQEDYQRKLEAVSALLWALQTHYSNFFKKCFSAKVYQQFIPKHSTGRLLKLRRQSLAILSSYL